MFTVIAIVALSSLATLSSLPSKCPSSARLKPCACEARDRRFSNDSSTPNVVDVTCAYAVSWREIKNALNSFRNRNYVVENLHITYVHDVRPSSGNDTMRRIFRRLTVENLRLDNCRLPERIPRNVFVDAYVNSLSLENSHLCKLPVRPLVRLRRTLTQLSLANNDVRWLTANTFRRFNDTLKLLNLHNNNFTTLPTEAFRSLNRLEILILSNNRIGELKPDAFLGFTNLLALELAYNEISTLSGDVFVHLKKLQHLGLRGNPLQTYSHAFERLPTLTSLDIVGTDVNLLEILGTSTKHSLETLVLEKTENLTAECLGNFSKLRELDVVGVASGDANSFDSLRTTNLEYLELSETDLSYDTLKYFPNLTVLKVVSNPKFAHRSNGTLKFDTFRTNIRLKLLNLEECSIEKIDYQTFWPLYENLQELNLRNNRLNRLDWRTLIKMKRLATLDLSYNFFVDKMPKNKTRRPVQPLNQSFFGADARHTLQKLILTGNNLIWPPARMLRRLASLKYLNMAANNIANIQLELSNNWNLEALKLSNNRIEYVHPQAFRNLHKLKVINFDNNPMLNLDPRVLPRFLEELSLRKNALCYFRQSSYFANLKQLKVVDLSYNALKTLKLEIFKDSEKSLLYIDLSNNPLHCSCKLGPFIDWLDDNRIKLSPETLCYTKALSDLRPLKDVCWNRCQKNAENSTFLNYDKSLFELCPTPDEASDDDDYYEDED